MITELLGNANVRNNRKAQNGNQRAGDKDYKDSAGDLAAKYFGIKLHLDRPIIIVLRPSRHTGLRMHEQHRPEKQVP